MTQASLKGTQIVIVPRENPEQPKGLVTIKPISQICAEIENISETEENPGLWIWRIDQIPTADAPSGMIFYFQWESIQAIQLEEITIIDLDLDYDPPQAPPPGPDSGPPSNGGNGNKVVNFHGPRKPPPGGATRKPHVRAPNQGLVT